MNYKFVKKHIRKIYKILKIIINRPQGFIDYVKDTYSLFAKKTNIAGLPVHITLEPTTACNLDCPVCETGNNTLMRSQGTLSIERFKEIIENIKTHTNTLHFYYMGETYLNKKADEMVKYATENNIYVKVCTNGEFVDPERLVDSGIQEIHFQIGGITQETHEVYRINGDLNKTLEKLSETIKIKNNKNSKYPKVILGFIVMKHNENQIEEFKSLCKDLNVDEYDIISPCVRTNEQGEEMLPINDEYWFYDKRAFEQGILKPQNDPGNKCDWLWYSTVITVNGDVVPCCHDPQGKHIMGNVFEEDLEKIWNNEKYKKFRDKILTDQKNIDICKLCSGYSVPPLY